MARPVENLDGSLNYLYWECSIPGPADTPWEGGQYYLSLEFDESYPETAPRARFVPQIFHVNVFPSGRVALSLLEEGWCARLTVRDVLLGAQRLLAEPNAANPANSEAYTVFTDSEQEYNDVIRSQALEFSLGEYEEDEDSET